VGFGKLAEDYYLPALRRLNGVQVIAVADPLPSRREKAKAGIPVVRTYASHDELLLHESLDGILVASPPSTHLQIWNHLRGQGIPIFIEKPFVLPGQLRQVMATVQASSRLIVNFNRRLWPLYRRLAELVRSGWIGDIENAEFTLLVNVRPWISVTEHRLLPSEGGPLYDLGSQVLDLIYFVLGREPVSIRVEGTSNRSEANLVNLTVELTNGLTVLAHVGYDRNNKESISLRGNKGRLQIHNPNMTIHTVTKDQLNIGVSERMMDWLIFGYRAFRRERSMLRYTVHASLKLFVDAVRGHHAFLPGLEDAIRNALWLEAAHQSLLAGKTVYIQDIKEQSTCLT
jgi:predicted dehydrogenase